MGFLLRGLVGGWSVVFFALFRLILFLLFIFCAILSFFYGGTIFFFFFGNWSLRPHGCEFDGGYVCLSYAAALAGGDVLDCFGCVALFLSGKLDLGFGGVEVRFAGFGGVFLVRFRILFFLFAVV